MVLKRRFRGVIPSAGELVMIEDWRDVIDTTTNHNERYRSTALGDEPHCRTTDGREVRCADAKYVNVDQLEGSWEILDEGEWKRLDVSPLLQD